MNPYGVSGNIFQSQANQSANSFSDPLNVAHLYPGWGSNPNYQTPAYDAPYRPSYQGPNPYAAYAKPTFAGGVNQLLSPAYKDPTWGNPVSNNQDAFNSIGQKPFDAAATVGQRFLMPALAIGMTQSLLRGSGSAIGKGMLSGMAGGLGMGAGVSGAAGAVGGFVGGLALPFAAGLGVAHAADAAIFQPYIRSRQMAGMAQDNFSGITFGGTGGNPISGRGLSGYQSAQIGSGIDRAGIRDMTFSSNQFHGIAAMGMQSGLFDDVGAGDITKKASSIAAQIKTILAISKDPNIQNAIQELAKLRLGGASTVGGAGSVAAGAYSMIGMQASAAGASVQRVMGTVGGQGQYMFQMNGLTPYLGQMAAANAYSGFAAAQRNGLLSTAQLARMGGIEGATQSSMAAQLSGISTPFNRMANANRYLGGAQTNGVVNTVSAFGQMASRDPLKMMGNMSLYGNAMASRQISEDGGSALEHQAIQYLQSIGKQPGPGGKYSPGEVAAVMESMGIPAEQIQSYAAMRSSQTDPGVVSQNIKAFQAQNAEQMRQILSQNAMYSGKIGRSIRAVRQGWKGFKEGTADMLAYPVTEAAGSVSDSVASGWDTLMHGHTLGDRLQDRMPGGKRLNMSSIDKKFSGGIAKQTASRRKLLNKLDEASRKPGPEGDVARELLSKGFDNPDSKGLFSKFLSTQSDPVLKREFEGLQNSPSFFNQIAADVRGNLVNSGDADASLETDLGTITGAKGTVSDNLRVLGQATGFLSEVHTEGVGAGLVVSDKLKEGKYSALADRLKGLSPEDQVKKINSMAVEAYKSGLAGSARIAGKINMSVDDVMKNPGAFSKDPAVIQAIRSAKGDKAAVQKIMNQEIARLSGGSLRGQSVDLVKGFSPQEYLAVAGSMDAATDSIHNAARDSSSGVDWKEFSTASGNLDKGAAVLLEGATLLRDTLKGATPGMPGKGKDGAIYGYIKGLF